MSFRMKEWNNEKDERKEKGQTRSKKGECNERQKEIRNR